MNRKAVGETLYLRIIGGSLKGRKLASLRGIAIRPTADRLRESVFNILSARIAGAAVLDLFAGTGAFGIEALSRHARSAVFVDNYRASEKIILRNLNMCRLTQRSRVIRWDIRRGFDGSRLPLREFDLVFMDPPYGRGLVRIGLVNLRHAPILAAGHRVVIEHSVHEPLAPDLQGYALHDQRRYGKTLVSFLECML